MAIFFALSLSLSFVPKGCGFYMTQEFSNANAQIKPIDVTVTLGAGAGELINQSLGNFVRFNPSVCTGASSLHKALNAFASLLWLLPLAK